MTYDDDQHAGAAVDERAEVAFGADFRSVRWFGEEFRFTPMQAAVVALLWEAHRRRTPALGQDYLLTEIDSRCKRLVDLFRREPGSRAWGRLIVPGETRGTYRLNLDEPDFPASRLRSHVRTHAKR